MPRSREAQLVDVARLAKRYFAGELHGQHDDIYIGRELVRILALYDDVTPIADTDRRGQDVSAFVFDLAVQTMNGVRR